MITACGEDLKHEHQREKNCTVGGESDETKRATEQGGSGTSKMKED